MAGIQPQMNRDQTQLMSLLTMPSNLVGQSHCGLILKTDINLVAAMYT